MAACSLSPVRGGAASRRPLPRRRPLPAPPSAVVVWRRSLTSLMALGGTRTNLVTRGVARFRRRLEFGLEKATCSLSFGAASSHPPSQRPLRTRVPHAAASLTYPPLHSSHAAYLHAFPNFLSTCLAMALLFAEDLGLLQIRWAYPCAADSPRLLILHVPTVHRG